MEQEALYEELKDLYVAFDKFYTHPEYKMETRFDDISEVFEEAQNMKVEITEIQKIVDWMNDFYYPTLRNHKAKYDAKGLPSLTGEETIHFRSPTDSSPVFHYWENKVTITLGRNRLNKIGKDLVKEWLAKEKTP